MAGVKQTPAGDLRSGSFIVIEGAACEVVDIQISRPGKHGHAKSRITGVGLIDGKKRIIVMPGHDNVDVPMVEKKNAQVLSITGDVANLMDSENFETFDLKIPGDLKDKVVEGVTILYWEILNDRLMKQLKT